MPDCAKCDSATSCTACSTFWLANNDYYAGSEYDKCVACPPESRLALPVVFEGKKICRKCSGAMPKDNCKTCDDSECLSCSRGFYLSDNECLPCEDVDGHSRNCVERVGGVVEILECSTAYAILGGRAPGNSCEKCQAPLLHRFDLVGDGYFSNNSTLY